MLTSRQHVIVNCVLQLVKSVSGPWCRRTCHGRRRNVEIAAVAFTSPFACAARRYYRGAHGALLVYDITSRESFESAQSWLAELRTHRGKDIVLMLVGNKLDLEARREVALDDALAFADKNDLAFMETSALTDVGVSAAFTSVIQGACCRCAVACGHGLPSLVCAVLLPACSCHRVLRCALARGCGWM